MINIIIVRQYVPNHYSVLMDNGMRRYKIHHDDKQDH